MVVYIAIVQGGIGAGQWLSFAPNIAQATAAANRILASRETEPEEVKGGGTYKADEAGADKGSERDEAGRDEASGRDEDGGKGGGARIEFSNVWFRYPTRDAPVLTGLDLTVGSGSPWVPGVGGTELTRNRSKRGSSRPLSGRPVRCARGTEEITH